MNVKRLSDLIAGGQVKGKRVFIRADLNVPQDDAGNITEDTRVRASIPCIQMALDAGAAVMVTSHLGRPTEGAANRRAVAAGQHPVDDRNIARALEGRLKPVIAVVKDIHIVLVAGQRAGDQRRELLVVFDDKNPHERY